MFAVATDFDYMPYKLKREQANNFATFIDDEEEKVLKEILGIALYNEFIEGLNEDYPAEKWLRIRDGATYELDGVPYEWAGLLTRKGAMVPYIYSRWTMDAYKQAANGSSLTAIAISENSELLGPGLAVRGHNDFVGMIGWNKWKKNTLYGLFIAYETDYPNLVWTGPDKMSMFDL